MYRGLSTNSLTGAIPESLGDISSLAFLCEWRCGFFRVPVASSCDLCCDVVPYVYGAHRVLGTNKFSGSLPQSIGRSPFLQQLCVGLRAPCPTPYHLTPASCACAAVLCACGEQGRARQQPVWCHSGKHRQFVQSRAPVRGCSLDWVPL